MRRLKRRIAGMMVGILCAMNVLQPLCTYADELPQTSETVMETVAETEAVQAPASEAAPESESPDETESGTVAAIETAAETEPTLASESETEMESLSESQMETELEIEPASEPIRYTVSGTYSGQGHMTITDNLGNVYEIPGPGGEKIFECDDQTPVILKISPDEGYEINAVEIDQQGNIESIADVEILNASEIYEKIVTVTADTKIKVAFAELPQAPKTETESESIPEVQTELEAESETGSEPAPESESIMETEPEMESETEKEAEPDKSQDGKLTEDEREEALEMSKEMDAAIKTNEAIMTLSLGEVGQNWGMYSLFTHPVIISEIDPTYVSDPYSHIIQTGPTYTEYTRTAYCIQYGTPIPAGSYTTETVLPQLQQNYMGYALAYGWKQTGTAYDESQYASTEARAEYAITQAIIWVCSRGKFNTDSGEAAINQIIQNTHNPDHAASYYQQLKAAILNAETIPSFSGSDSGAAPTIQLEWSAGNSRFEATVTDANGVLDRYNYSCAGINFEKSGNNLTIWTTNSYADGVTASAVYTTTGGSNAVVTWDGAAGTQDLATYADIPNNIYSYIRIETENLGSLELIKTSANSAITDNSSCYSLAGAVYGVYNAANQEIGRITTDVNGWGQLTDIPTGSYTVKEITAPKGFAVDVKSHAVTIVPGQKTTVNVKDYPQTDPVSILLTKVSADSGIGIANAEFTVKYYSNYDASGTPERTWVLRTDDRGFTRLSNKYKVSGDDFYTLEGVVTLPLGTVTIQETKAPEGYLINEEVFVRQITSDGPAEQVTTYNAPTIPETPQVIQIELYKVDSETNKAEAQGTGSLAGAEYNVVDADNTVSYTHLTLPTNSLV